MKKYPLLGYPLEVTIQNTGLQNLLGSLLVIGEVNWNKTKTGGSKGEANVNRSLIKKCFCNIMVVIIPSQDARKTWYAGKKSLDNCRNLCYLSSK